MNSKLLCQTKYYVTKKVISQNSNLGSSYLGNTIYETTTINTYNNRSMFQILQ